MTTPTGNTGRGVLSTVMAADASVRVLVRDRAKLADAPDDLIEGDLRDAATIDAALADVGTAFFCVPQSENPDDLVVYCNSFAVPFATVAKTSGLRRLVVISGGDDEGENAGPGKALRSNEDIFAKAIPACRFVRCGYFMENLLWQVQTIAHAGMFTLPVAPDVPIAFVAADDIGAACGRLMLDEGWSDTSAVEAYGPVKVTMAEAAAIISHAIGKPVRYVEAEPGAWAAQMQGYGLSAAMATSLIEMFAAISVGRDMGGEPAAPLACPTTLEAWCTRTLAPAVRQAAA